MHRNLEPDSWGERCIRHTHARNSSPTGGRWKGLLHGALVATALGFLGVMNACGGGGGAATQPAASQPTITAQPASLTKSVGGSAHFAVTATATGTLSYQWRKGGADLSGQTGSSLDLASLGSTDAGSYDVVVTSTLKGTTASRTSSTATLTVTNAAQDSTTATTTVTVATVSGCSLALTITGLGTLPGDVTVTGPNAYSQHLTATQTLTVVENGTYTLTAATVTDSSQPGLGRANGGTLGPEFLQRYPYQPVQTVTVSGGNAVSASVDYPPATSTFDLPLVNAPGSTTPLNLVFIPGGIFTMGSPDTELHRSPNEGPQHAVTLSPFAMAKFEITQAQWVALMGSNPSYFQSPVDLTRPVEQVSYNDITMATTGFLAKLNDATAATRPAGLVFRLPTEAEWEYAARGRTTTRFYWGDDPGYTVGNAYAWWQPNYSGSTHPVGQKLGNAFGLCDMAGNVYEWCQDWYGAYDNGAQADPAGPLTQSCRVLRGADYFSNTSCRSALRTYGDPPLRDHGAGFRVVLASPRTP